MKNGQVLYNKINAGNSFKKATHLLSTIEPFYVVEMIKCQSMLSYNIRRVTSLSQNGSENNLVNMT